MQFSSMRLHSSCAEENVEFSLVHFTAKEPHSPLKIEALKYVPQVTDDKKSMPNGITKNGSSKNGNLLTVPLSQYMAVPTKEVEIKENGVHENGTKPEKRTSFKGSI